MGTNLQCRKGRGRGDDYHERAGESNGDHGPEGSIRSLIPARLDRLGWSRFHTRLVIALGVAWVLDGLEITIASNAEGLISQKPALNLSSSEVAFAVGTVYLLGEVVGALFFGRMSDKFGRRNLFMITLGVYLFGGVMTAFTLGHSQGWVYWVWASRFIAGMGIGGEYAAINSAIDELIPAKYRGRVDIAVNGTYWGGALIGTLLLHLRREPPARQLLLAGRLPGRAGAGLRHPLRAQEPAREPALAPHARARAGGRGRRQADRGADEATAAAPSVTSTSPRPLRSHRPTTSASLRWPGRCSSTIRGGPSSGPP